MKKSGKKILSVCIILCLLLSFPVGCSKKEKDSNKTIKVGVFDMPTLYLMQTFDEMGYYEKNNANVEFVYFPVYSDAISAFNTGNVDMMCYAVAEGVTPVVNGIDCKVIGVFDTSDGLDGIAASKDITSVKDLKGKTVATEIGTVDHMMLQYALEENGMTESDINILNMSAGDAVAALAGGTIDAVSTWEPQLSMAAENGGIIYSTKDAPNLITDVFLIRTSVLDEQYDNAKAILKTWYESVGEYLETPDQFAESAAKKGNLTVDEFYDLMDVTALVSLEDNKVAFTEGTEGYEHLNVLLRTVGDFLYDGKLIEKELTDSMISNMIDDRIINDLRGE